jgi:transcriptional regulator with XRE-family HTH domain
VAQGSPTVRRRELGTLLRKLRNENGLTVDQVAERLLCSPSKVSRMETGHRGATLRDVRDLCDLYGVTGEGERDRLMTLAKEGKQQGWWQSYDLPYSTYIGLEAEAVSIKDYDSAVIPGLLQTPEYVRALHEDVAPQRDAPPLAPDVIDQRVEERLRRQELLRRTEPPPLEFWAVLDEAVLHRVIGSPEVMRAQLRHLINVSNLANVTVQIVPFTVGAHPALGSTFNILQFSGPLADVVYVEGLLGWIYLERPEDIARYRNAFERLSEIAMDPGDSTDLIEKTIGSFGSGLTL